MVEGPADAAMLKLVPTLTTDVAAAVQPVAFVTVTEYVVVPMGEAVTVVPVESDKALTGLHENTALEAPDVAVSVTVCPGHVLLVVGVTLIDGGSDTKTFCVTVALSLQPVGVIAEMVSVTG
jgi:hypothetical protein